MKNSSTQNETVYTLFYPESGLPVWAEQAILSAQISPERREYSSIDEANCVKGVVLLVVNESTAWETLKYNEGACVLLLGENNLAEKMQAAVDRGAFAFVTPEEGRRLATHLRNAARLLGWQYMAEQKEQEWETKSEQFRALREHSQRLLELGSDLCLVIKKLPKTGLQAVWISPSVEQVAGYTLKDFNDSEIWATMQSPEDLNATIAFFDQLKPFQPNSIYKWMYFKDGSLHYLHERVMLVTDEKNEPLYYYVVLKDETDNRQALKRLEQLNERYSLFLELASDFLYTIKVEPSGLTYMEWISESLTRQSGYTLEDIEQAGFLKSAIILEKPDELNVIKKVIVDAKPATSQHRVIFRDGQVHTLRNYLRPVVNPETGRVERVYAAVKDITNEQAKEDELRESNERYAAISGLTSDYIYTMKFRPDGTFFVDWVSDSYEQHNGYSPEEVSENLLIGEYHPDDMPRIMAAFNGFLAGAIMDVVFRLRYRDGSWHWLHNYCRPIFNTKTGKIERGVGAAKDITHEKNAQIALEESERKYRTLVESSGDLIFTFELDGRLLYANRAAMRKFMIPANSAYNVYNEIYNRAPRIPKERIDWLKKELQAGQTVSNLEVKIKNDPYGPLYIEGRVTPMPHPVTNEMIAYAFFQDHTENWLAREQITEVESKMSAMLQNFNEPVWAYDLDFNLLFFNPAFYRIATQRFRQTPEIGKPFLVPFVMPEGWRQPQGQNWRWISYLSQALKGRRLTENFNFGFRKQDVFYEFSVTPILQNYAVAGIAFVGNNVSDRKRSEERIRKINASLTALIENRTDVIWSLETDGSFGHCNTAFIRLFTEYTASLEETGNGLRNFFDLFKPHHDRAFQGESFLIQHIFTHLNPEQHYEFAFNPIKENEKIIGVSVFGRNVTKRNLREIELLKKNAIFQFARDAILITNHQNTVDCNPAAVELFEMADKEAMLEAKQIDYSPEFQPSGQPSYELLKEQISKILKSTNIFYEWRYKTAKGREFDAEVLVTKIHFEGELLFSVVIRDITERLEAEKKARQLEKEMMNAIIQGQDQERRRIAEELHDGLGQYVHAARINLESLLAQSDNLTDDQRHSLNYADQILAETMIELRHISHNLMPRMLQDFGLAHALKTLCERMASGKLQLHFFSDLYKRHFDKALEASIYRMTQEALSNVVKHARAETVNVQLTIKEKTLLLMIEDDGVGFDLNDSNNKMGIGLSNMRTRAKVMGGELIIETNPNEGVMLMFEIEIAE